MKKSPVTPNRPLRIGIVGAGLNASYHLRFARAYPAAQIVGLADADGRRAEECARAHGIAHAFGSAADLLRTATPDVVHVVTPPTTHAAVVREALEAGCHVLVEKPLALNLQDARALYDIARQHEVKLCPMHNHLFDPCMRRAADLIQSGALGRVINVESYYGLNTQIPAFREYSRPNELSWLYGLPGGVYQDFLPHPLYVLLPYTGGPRRMTVMKRSTGVLPQDMADEIRILIDGAHAFGTMTLSFAARPHLHFLRVYGTRMMVEVDFNTMTTIAHRVSALPKAAQKATYNLDDSWQRARSTASNMVRFVTGKLKPYHGMMNLIHAYYDALRTGGPLPVSQEQALEVVQTMDSAIEQLNVQRLKHDPVPAAARAIEPGKHRVLVTGGTGFVGRRLVKRLLEDGHSVRVLARKLADVSELTAAGAEVCWGDVADIKSFGVAFAGCDRVVHLAAGTSGSEKDARTATVQGTSNLLDLCRRYRPGKLVYISSCSVYGIADYASRALVSETSPLERSPELRGSYSASKQQAEAEVAAYMKTGDLPVVILRPGTVYGPGGELYTPMIGFSFGSQYLVIGRGNSILPLVYVDNLVDAIVRTLDKREADGEVFNVVDAERLSKREYMNRVIRRARPDARVMYLPYSFLYAATWFQELAFKLLRRRPVLSRYRLTCSQKPVVYDSGKIRARLGWMPPVSQRDALESLIASVVVNGERMSAFENRDSRAA